MRRLSLFETEIFFFLGMRGCMEEMDFVFFRRLLIYLRSSIAGGLSKSDDNEVVIFFGSSFVVGCSILECLIQLA